MFGEDKAHGGLSANPHFLPLHPSKRMLQQQEITPATTVYRIWVTR